MRESSSVKFETYYKIQRWEARSLAWKDIQRSYSSVDDAEESAPAGERDTDWRIMEITETGRHPLPLS
jgi:hypothetical protein